MPEAIDERDLATWRAAFAAHRHDGSAECPDEESLTALATGALEGEARQRLADHVVACRRCGASFATLLELEAAAVEVRRAEAVRRRSLWLGAAAAFALAVGLGLWAPWAGVGGREEGTRGAPATAARWCEPANGARLAGPPARLAWAAVPGATRYRVRLFDDEMTRLWESEPRAATAVDLPAELRGRLAAGRTYYWRVSAESGGGWSEGPLSKFDLAP